MAQTNTVDSFIARYVQAYKPDYFEVPAPTGPCHGGECAWYCGYHRKQIARAWGTRGETDLNGNTRYGYAYLEFTDGTSGEGILGVSAHDGSWTVT